MEREIVDADTYEVLRARLARAAADLTERAEALNARRTAEFGGGGLTLAGTGRLSTARPARLRDAVAVGALVLVGSLPQPGPAEAIGDVLALYRPDLAAADAAALPGLLEAPGPARDFDELHRYFRDARLDRLRLDEGRLHAVFRTGPAEGDERTLRWQLDDTGRARYLDARGERGHPRPDAQQVAWVPAGRDDHVPGRPPRLSLGGELLLATEGGVLRLTAPDGRDLHEEPLDEPLQTLADAEIGHARTDTLLLVRIRPYQEATVRHLLCHLPTGRVTRIDALGQACLRLPGDQGLAFPGGYALADGRVRVFDQPAAGLLHDRTVRSPNGEDVLYAFRDPADGRTLLMPYNSVRQEAAAPLPCRAHALLDDGTLLLFGATDGPARLHPVQTWHTPFADELHAAARPVGHGPLARIGNADLVRGIADCLALARQAAAPAPGADDYRTVLAAARRTADRHHWLADPDTGDLHRALAAIRDSARQALAAHESVAGLAADTARTVEATATRTTTLLRLTRGESPATAEAWVTALAELRRAQGEVESLRELHHVDTDRVDRLAADLADGLTDAATRAVDHLAAPDAFTHQRDLAADLVARSEALTASPQAEPLHEEATAQTAALQTVADLVTTLDLADAATRTGILDRLADVLGLLNRARTTLTARRRALRTRESAAEFAAESALLAQATAAALAAADTPQSCDDQLARLLLRIEQLDARFADADPALADRLAARRTEIHTTLTTRRQNLVDERVRRAERLAASADRILAALRRHLAALDSPRDIDTALASDPMAVKVRQLADQLGELGDPVRADQVTTALRAARDQAHRSHRDRAELSGAAPGTLRLGRHLFTAAPLRPELTIVPRPDGPVFALTGTDYRSPVTDPAFARTRPHWDQRLPSETPEVYRAEYLAARLLLDAEPDRLPALHEALATGRLPDLVREAAERRTDEGYRRGVHDHDATAVLTALLTQYAAADTLRHPAAARAAAQLFWAHGTDEGARHAWTVRSRSLGRAREAFGSAPALAALAAELQAEIDPFATATGIPAARAGHYLVEELARTALGFAARPATAALLEEFHARPGTRALADALAALPADPALLPARHQLAHTWLQSFTTATGHPATPDDLAEATATLLTPDLPRRTLPTDTETRVEDLRGDHPRLRDGRLAVRLDELLTRAADFHTVQVPSFRAYQRLRGELLEREHARLRLTEHLPAPLNGFVRNRLIDEVYLPLIGDNLARQLGTADGAARTDRSGLLLLLSPPGYGKTTLVEYLAERLGMLLVTVSGPALGHGVTSLDPAQAPDATSRREIEKLNFALHAGSNTLLYVDDIQHTSPDFLQRFIPLCDARRRVEGVWDGRPREWDLRGKRFAVVMAANPYTESGRSFRVPDMLANRADVWNLGDAVTGRHDLFALSFIENALTANPHLAPLATAERAELDLLLRRAAGEPGAPEPDPVRPPEESGRITAVLSRLLAVRETVLAVNRAYVDSAAQHDRDRTEPPFRLQGSYRDMNRIAQRVAPVMDDAEVQALITDHYRAEAQALGQEAEAQLLRLAELRGTLTTAQARRWQTLRNTFTATHRP
ncbi:DNA repair ATPase [Kitasatospora sp. NA04385]|uniref:DNA repair ATPase n=1 Tax=Kitasatospora sp. NA04385 TaxID=2742135 RepID=UPI00159064D1|nr:DNA repair ATPase [Kitasatospora sp. NA04385]QKW18181.1 DNA repair ATPase [Kitasatospora sp. NA04385]